MDISRAVGVPRSLAARFSRRGALLRFGAASLVAAGAGRAGTLAAQDASPIAGAGQAGYLVIRRYHLKPDASIAELVRRIEAGFVPIIGAVPGFLRYTLVEPGDGTHVAVSLFADQAGADESTRRATGWAEQEVSELVELPAFEVIAGPVVLDVFASAPATPVP